MDTIKAYLALCRASNLPTIWTNVLAGGLLATGHFVPSHFLLLAMALSCFYLAGMCLNDICDADYDRLQRPSRPIPSQRVSVRGAKTFTLLLFAGGMLLLTAAPNLRGAAAAILLLLTIVAYDLRHKQNHWSVLLMAACRFQVFAVASLALTGRLPAPVLLAGGIQFLYVVLISLVARYENNRPAPFPFPLIPAMLAGISMLDGILLALLISPVWLAGGMLGALFTWVGQRFVRGD